MIRAFLALGQGNPELLAQGIAEALTNTGMGLFVAVVAYGGRVLLGAMEGGRVSRRPLVLNLIPLIDFFLLLALFALLLARWPEALPQRALSVDLPRAEGRQGSGGCSWSWTGKDALP